MLREIKRLPNGTRSTVFIAQDNAQREDLLGTFPHQLPTGHKLAYTWETPMRVRVEIVPGHGEQVASDDPLEKMSDEDLKTLGVEIGIRFALHEPRRNMIDKIRAAKAKSQEPGA